MSDTLQLQFFLNVEYNSYSRDITFTVTIKNPMTGAQGNKQFTHHEWDGFRVPIVYVKDWLNDVLKSPPFKFHHSFLDRVKRIPSPTYKITSFAKTITGSQLPKAYKEQLNEVFIACEELKEEKEIKWHEPR